MSRAPRSKPAPSSRASSSSPSPSLLKSSSNEGVMTYANRVLEDGKKALANARKSRGTPLLLSPGPKASATKKPPQNAGETKKEAAKSSTTSPRKKIAVTKPSTVPAESKRSSPSATSSPGSVSMEVANIKSKRRPSSAPVSRRGSASSEHDTIYSEPGSARSSASKKGDKKSVSPIPTAATLSSILDKLVSVTQNPSPNEEFKKFITEMSKPIYTQQIILQLPEDDKDVELSELNELVKKEVKEGEALLELSPDKAIFSVSELKNLKKPFPAPARNLLRSKVNGVKSTRATHRLLDTLESEKLIYERLRSRGQVIPNFIEMSTIPLDHTDTEHGVAKEKISVTMKRLLTDVNSSVQSNNSEAAVDHAKILKKINSYKPFIRAIRTSSGRTIFQFTRLFTLALDNYAENLLKMPSYDNHKKATKTLIQYIKDNKDKYVHAYQIILEKEAEMMLDFFIDHFPTTGTYKIYYNAVMERFIDSFKIQIAFSKLADTFVTYAQQVQRNERTPAGRRLSNNSKELFEVLTAFVAHMEAKLKEDYAKTEKSKQLAATHSSVSQSPRLFAAIPAPASSSPVMLDPLSPAPNDIDMDNKHELPPSAAPQAHPSSSGGFPVPISVPGKKRQGRASSSSPAASSPSYVPGTSDPNPTNAIASGSSFKLSSTAASSELLPPPVIFKRRKSVSALDELFSGFKNSIDQLLTSGMATREEVLKQIADLQLNIQPFDSQSDSQGFGGLQIGGDSFSPGQ